METFTIILKEEHNSLTKVPFLCSKEIFLKDKIFFELEKNLEILDGIVEEIDYENQLVTILNNNKTFSANYKKCFFPIIEVFNNGEIFHKQEIQRDKLYFSNICPKCEKNSRDLDNCSFTLQECSKKEKKPYAFIKL
jgi:DNA gyrase/topoisomerase IV subunit B